MTGQSAMFRLQSMTTVYVIMFLVTLSFLAVLYLRGKRKFGRDSECMKTLAISIVSYLRVTSLLAGVSLFLITAKKVPDSVIPFLCIPFFVINTGLFGTYFRLSKYDRKMGQNQ